ncbi:hypothetical protein GCM10009547_44740 [Sporichthya brevicatena]|uniref:Uncharacterized protein n=1 Tax=Sporichthya brevicatena TaxID=171442 RepID=A0ABN1HAR8_9ACTN
MRASKKVKGAVLLSAGAALVLGAPTVHADSKADGNNGLVSGLNLLNDVQLNVPVTVGGAGVLGVGEGKNTVKTTNEGSGSGSGSSGKSSADDNSGLVSGANVGNNLQANVPVTVCGVGALLARGEGDCEVRSSNSGGGGGTSSADDNEGLVAGANALNNAQLNVPVTVCGLGVLGNADCEADVRAANSGSGDSDDDDSDLLGSSGDSSSDGNSGLVSGLNLLNGLDANVPVTVCGLAVLGDADATCEVEATNTNGDGDVLGVSTDRPSAVRGATLPHTGAAGLALIPFGMALVAGGVALRRRVGSES